MNCWMILLGIGVLVCASAAAEPDKVPIALEAFDLEHVRLSDGPCKDALETNRRYLHELDADRLLHNFRANAGLPAPGKPLGGWEGPEVEVRGHFTGHYLSACALMFRATGDEDLKKKADFLVAELAKCQKALGGEYLSAFPASFWDRLESGEKIPWAPYYTIHKIMAGLFDMYSLCGNQQALDVLKGMAAYYKKRLEHVSDAQMARILRTEFGGMSEVLHNLHSVTHDPSDLALAHRFDQPAFLDPLAEQHDDLSNIHANTQIPKICGAARRYELTGDPRYRTITSYFWDRIAHHRSYATGGSTDGEGWGEPDKLAHALSATNQECCTTYNILRVTRYLLRWTGDSSYGDFYERAFLNGILGTQEPGTGQLMYYVPLATGFRRPFGTPNDSFWCCYGTGIESFSKLGDSIYFHDGSSVYVNLFIASELRWPEKGLRLVQDTRFPDEDATRFTIHTERPVQLALRIRIPAWVAGDPSVTLNGEPVRSVPKAGTIFTMRRTWKEGDRVEVRLPMTLHAEPMPDDPDLVAVMHGPVVLAGIVGQTGANTHLEGGPVSASAADAAWPKYMLGDAKRPDSWLKPVEGRPHAYRTIGQAEQITFEPFYKVVHEPYGIYWSVLEEGSPKLQQIKEAEEAQRKLAARSIDSVAPNDAASERAHNLQGQETGAGPYGGRAWRHAVNGGWFSWDLKALPDVPLTLVCTYWGSDTGGRTFDILVDGQRIATQTLDRSKPGEFFDVQYPISPDLTRGKTKITVRFQARPGNFAGGVFACALLRPESAR